MDSKVQTDDLDAMERKILNRLERYPHTRKHLADELDVTGDYIYQTIRVLDRLGKVTIIHDGYYERAGWRRENAGEAVRAEG